jgi:3-oxoacyl-[acyl-carrier protein] reductase
MEKARTAIVTGGSAGIGRAIACALSARGWQVAIGGRRPARLEEAVAAVAQAGGHAFGHVLDVSDPDSVDVFVSAAEKALGPVDLLVNNAAVTRYVPFADLAAVREEDWQRAFGVNVLGAWNCVRAVAPGMRARAAGAIVNVASDSVLTLDGSSIPYVVSKAALVALTRTLARALAPLVRVNAVAPGWMETPWLDRNLPEDVRRKLAAGAEGMTDVADVCREVLRLLADDAASGEIVLIAGPPVD